MPRKVPSLSSFRANDHAAHSAWADDFERRAIGSRQIAGAAPLCAHQYDAAGRAACIARQLAALAAEETK